MKPHPRIRKTIKWGGAAVTVLVVVWIGSGWWVYTEPMGQTQLLVVGQGRATLFQPANGRVDEDKPRGGLPHQLKVLVMDPVPSRYPCGVEWHKSFLLRWGLELPGGQCAYNGVVWIGKAIAIPAWPLALSASAITMTAWRSGARVRRRARLNLCPKCNYDRAGIAGDARCPECGTRRA